MSNEIDFDEILSKYRSDPYDYMDITATHTGVVNFQVEKGVEVDAPGGEWNHLSGTAVSGKRSVDLERTLPDAAADGAFW